MRGNTRALQYTFLHSLHDVNGKRTATPPHQQHAKREYEVSLLSTHVSISRQEFNDKVCVNANTEHTMGHITTGSWEAPHRLLVLHFETFKMPEACRAHLVSSSNTLPKEMLWRRFATIA